MHPDGATYHVYKRLLRPCEHPSRARAHPADIPVRMRSSLLKTRAGKAASLRLRELINGLKAESDGERAWSSGAPRGGSCVQL